MKLFVFSLLLFLFLYPTFVWGAVLINEIAWMGTAVSANDEWIELYNNGTEDVGISGWRLKAFDGQPDILIDDACANETIIAGGYFLLERTDDDSVSGIAAGCIYTGALSNTSEHLQLFDASGSLVDSVNATSGWLAGDNITKETMQKTGAGWTTSAPTPKASNVSDGSGDSPEDVSGTSADTSSHNTQAGGADEPYVQPENLPRIKVHAGKDQFAAVGEQVQFRAEAWGLDNKALENARYMWNFGDGATYEGRNVAHEYMFPGTYMARVIVSSGKYSALDDLQVVVHENTVRVSEAMPGETGWIEFQNRGEQAIHVGGWILETTHNRFIIPIGTVLLPQSFAVLSAATTRIVLEAAGDHIYLFYPNGTYAHGFSYVFQAPQGKSISNNEGAALFTEPTPGSFSPLKNPVVADSEEPTHILSAPLVSYSSPAPQNAKQLAKLTLQEQEELPINPRAEHMDAKEPDFQPAALGDTPLLSKTNREAYWFGGSLVLGGLLAVGAVFLQRKKYPTDGTHA